MRREIPYKNITLTDRIHIISALRKMNLSTTEASVLAQIITYSSNGSTILDVGLTKDIRTELNITSSLFNTAIHRLVEKRTITKQGKVVTLHPLYNKIDQITELLIKFQ